MQEGAELKLSNEGENSSADIFRLLHEASKKRKKRERERLLKLVDVKEFFEEGSTSIDDRTCQGLECELCIKVCPTKALYWLDGKVGIINDLCVYCGACVLNCIVDDCIEVTRKRLDGKVERFSKPRDIILLCQRLNSQRRHSRVKAIFPDAEAYLERYGKMEPRKD